MSGMLRDLEKINEIYRRYAETTLPQGRGWILFLGMGLGIPGIALVIIHRILGYPLLHPTEPDLVLIVVNLVVTIFVVGMLLQGRGKASESSRMGVPEMYQKFQPLILSLAPFPEASLQCFLGYQKEEWAEAEKQAETAAAVVVVLGTLCTTVANWWNQPKFPAATVLMLVGLTFFVLTYARYRISKLRHFEFVANQAIKEKETKELIPA